jgi:hypothetical protein
MKIRFALVVVLIVFIGIFWCWGSKSLMTERFLPEQESEEEMANANVFSVGGTDYNVKDTTARSAAAQVASDLSQAVSSLGDSIEEVDENLISFEKRFDMYQKRLAGYYVDEDGIVTQTSGAKDTICFQVRPGNVINFIKTQDDIVVYAFFVNEPASGSQSYNQSRNVVNGSLASDITVPDGCKWLTVRCNSGGHVTIEPDSIMAKEEEVLYLENTLRIGKKRIAGCYIDTDGRIKEEPTPTHDVICLQVEFLTKLDIIKADDIVVACAFYEDEPYIWSESYNGSRTTENGSVSAGIIVPVGCKWIAVRCNAGGDVTISPTNVAKTEDVQYIENTLRIGKKRYSGCYIDSDGRIKGDNSFSGKFDVLCFQVDPGSVIEALTTDDENIVCYAFYKEDPAYYTTYSYNEQRVVVNNVHTVRNISVPSDCTWIAVRTLSGTDATIYPTNLINVIKESVEMLNGSFRGFDVVHSLKAPADVRTWIVYGDSIFASGYDQITETPYEQPPRGCNAKGFPRKLYQKLNEGRSITWRNAGHSDWTYTGTSSLNGLAVDPDLWGKERDLSDGATAQIAITGAKKVVFLFVADRTQTTGVSIQVSKDGGSAVNPSTILNGEITKKGTLDSPVYATAVDSLNLGFTVASANNYNKYSCFKRLIYNGLDEESGYTFTFTASGFAKLWGCGYTADDMIDLVYVNSRSGMSWNDLYACRESDIFVPQADYVILEAPMWHDHTESDALSGAEKLISVYAANKINTILCSCPPGGIVVTGSTAPTLGDEFSSYYYQGQNIVKDARQNSVMLFNTPLSNTTNYPVRGEEYSCTIDGISYTVKFWAPESMYSVTTAYITVPDNFPNSVPAGTQFTKTSSVSESSIASFAGKDFRHYSVAIERHRDLMAMVAKQYNIPFVDVLGAFEDIAHSVGEEIDSDAWEMSPDHPFYAVCEERIGSSSYPTLERPFIMNYMSNFFKVEDGHHLINPAHDVIWQILEYNLFDN